MYAQGNPKSKAELKRRIAAGEKIRIFQPGGIFNPPEAAPDFTGFASLEGPHYPAPHTWYGRARVEGGVIVEVK